MSTKVFQNKQLKKKIKNPSLFVHILLGYGPSCRPESGVLRRITRRKYSRFPNLIFQEKKILRDEQKFTLIRKNYRGNKIGQR